MDERIKESISALMDDEVNELELQRALAQLEDEDVAEIWQRYHLARDVIRGESYAPDMSASLSIGVSQAVSEWIEQDQQPLKSDQAEDNATAYSLPRVGGLLSLAASVIFAVVFVLQNHAQHDVTFTNVAQANDQQDNALEVVANRQPKIIDQISDDQAKRLNHYLLRHAEHSMLGARQGAMPFVRVASVNSVGI